LARAPLSVLSGGELQRLRIAQALAGDPVLLLCDEPLLNLDPASAQQVSELIENLSQLYQTEVDVVRVRGQYVVVGNRGFCHE
jgi:zinc/manganese transport system ATP-binding protein